MSLSVGIVGLLNVGPSKLLLAHKYYVFVSQGRVCGACLVLL